MLTSRYERIFLCIQDIAVLLVSLWLTLALRYQAIPQWDMFLQLLAPFSLLFIAWVIIYLIAGLYEKQSTLWKKRLPARLMRAQLMNSAVAVAFFYLIPYFSISPKTILFMYVVLSGLLLVAARLLAIRYMTPRKKQMGLLIAGGVEKDKLVGEINNNNRYGLLFSSIIDLDTVTEKDLVDSISQTIAQKHITTVVIDLDHPKIQTVLSSVYRILFSKVNFINFNTLYESVFDCIPLSSVTHGWFLEYVSLQPRYTYEAIKRGMDLFLAGIALILSLPFYAVAYILIKLDDGGPIFITQDRIGQGNKIIKITKFRSMTTDDAGEYDTTKAKVNRITRVGAFLRKSRIDELPQLLSVLRGDQSLIGPRPELPALVALYEKDIPYYNVRHMLKPGLSGWAQIYADHGHGAVAFEVTKEKLSYDLFYVKNRSVSLDIMIALKTIQILLSFVGK